MIKNFLSEEQNNLIDYLMEGKNISDIARILNKSRSTIYKWIELDQVKTELETRKAEVKDQARTKIASKVGNCIENLIEIASTCKDVRTKFQANKYLVDQFLGTPGANQEKALEEDRTVSIGIDIDTMLDEINKMEKSQ